VKCKSKPFIDISVAVIKTLSTARVAGLKKTGVLTYDWWECTMTPLLWKTGSFSKCLKKKSDHLAYQAVALLSTHLEEEKT
jgi:hypothetical protein